MSPNLLYHFSIPPYVPQIKTRHIDTYLIKFYSFAFLISVAQKKILKKQKIQNISLPILHHQSSPAALTKERRPSTTTTTNIHLYTYSFV